jgi:hypothetical protein
MEVDSCGISFRLLGRVNAAYVVEDDTSNSVVEPIGKLTTRWPIIGHQPKVLFGHRDASC